MVYGLSPVIRGLRTFGMLVVIGFLTLVLAPPVLALVTALLSLMIGVTSAFLPFAVVGLLVWVPYQLLRHGPDVTWQRTKEMTLGLARTTVAAPFRGCGAVWHGVRTVGHAAYAFHCQLFRFLGLVFLEALSGALVGLLVAVVTAGQSPLRGEHVLLCSGVGAALGTLLGIVRFRPVREVEQAT